MFVEIIGWLGTIFMLLGSITNIYKHLSCWPLWIIGGALIILQAIMQFNWNILVMQLIYMPLNIYGWIEWRNNR